MSEEHGKWDEMRERIIGLGEQSSRKSYYPELQKKIEQLEDAREKIRVSEANLRAVIDGVHDAIIIHTYDGEILDINESFVTLFDVRPGAVEKFTVADISAPDSDMVQAAGIWESVKGGQPALFEWRARKPKTGEVLDVEVALRPLKWYGRDVIIAEVRDISDRKRLELMLRQSQKMDAIGQLAGGFAHDFNNLLGGIIGYAELLTLTAADNPVVSEYAHVIMNTATQAAEMARRLLDFSRKNIAKKAAVDVKEILKKTISLLERTIDRKISIECECDGRPRIIFADVSQLQNAFLNVCINARDAMPNGGKISLGIRDLELRTPEVFGAFKLGAGLYVDIRISDTGTGMPREIMDRIFEPFFTTKETGKGTGLGLTAVYGCVRDHSGAVTVESRKGKGTSFRFIFPLHSETVDDHPAESCDIAQYGSGERVLVVDDEETLREMAKEMLSRIGYEVETAADGIEALEKYRKRVFDLVLLDAIMPRMNGAETFEGLKAINPAVKVIFCSGYSEGVLSSEQGKPGSGYLQKPFSLGALSEIIRKVIETR